jgi:hypothetical protein
MEFIVLFSEQQQNRVEIFLIRLKMKISVGNMHLRKEIDCCRFRFLL